MELGNHNHGKQATPVSMFKQEQTRMSMEKEKQGKLCQFHALTLDEACYSPGMTAISAPASPRGAPPAISMSAPSSFANFGFVLREPADTSTASNSRYGADLFACRI